MVTASSWNCPNCRRRVPRYASACHCGTRRADAETVEAGLTAPAHRHVSAWRQLPLSVWLPLLVAAAAAITLVVLLFLPSEPPPAIPLGGYVDRIPTPQPKR